MQGISINAFAYQENAIVIELQQLVELQGAGNYNNRRRYRYNNYHYVSYPLGDCIVSKEFRTAW